MLHIIMPKNSVVKLDPYWTANLNNLITQISAPLPICPICKGVADSDGSICINCIDKKIWNSVEGGK